MKLDELRALPSDDLKERLNEAVEEAFNLRFQNATGQLENYKRIGLVKRDIARIRTLLQERELGIDNEPALESARARRRVRKQDTKDETKDEPADNGGEESDERGEE